jgi:hypothetical protein
MRIIPLLLLLAGCAHQITDFQSDQEQRGTDDVLPFITTNWDVYHAEVGQMVVAGDTVRYLEFTIEMTYTNRSARSTYLRGCRGPAPPRLEYWADGRWQVAYDPPHTMCGPDFVTIAAGCRRRS